MPVGRITDRATFDALHRSRVRASSGVVRMTHAADLAPTVGSRPLVRVAYATSRKVGGAVQRNRVRRRARAVLAEQDSAMMPGAYLVSFAPGAAEVSFEELRTDVDRALSRLAERIAIAEGGRARPTRVDDLGPAEGSVGDG